MVTTPLLNTIMHKAQRIRDRVNKTWVDIVAEYEERIRDGPVHQCYSCDRLFFKRQVTNKYRNHYIFVFTGTVLQRSLTHVAYNKALKSA